MLKFSRANYKIRGLYAERFTKKYLKGNRKVYSFDLLSGWSCPYAGICLTKVHEDEHGNRRIVDGKNSTVRCFSASQEVMYPAVYNQRKANYSSLSKLTKDEMVKLILQSLPANIGILRLHVGGDFFNQKYFDAWVDVASQRPDILIYFYTKSLPYLIKRKTKVDSMTNIVYTASVGGKRDDLISKHNLRNVEIIFDEDTDRIIDHNDSSASDPSKRSEDFALLIHGTQRPGSMAGKAKSKLKGRGSYGKASTNKQVKNIIVYA